MPLAIPQTTTTPNYTDAGAAVFDFGGTGYYLLYFYVMNAGVYLSFRRGSSQGSADWGPEFPVPPSSLTLSAGSPSRQRPFGSELIWGIRCRTLAGNVPPTLAAPWSAIVNYVVGDVVTLGTATYVAVAASLNQTPPNTTYWQNVDATVFGSAFQPGEATISNATANTNAIAPSGVVVPPSLETTDGALVVLPTNILYIGNNLTLTTPATGTARIDASGGVSVDVQVFTAGTAQTWTKPAGVSAVWMSAIGAGGGGAGGSSATTANTGAANGGGGGAGHFTALYRAADLPASLSVDVGTGGTGGIGTNNGNDGSPSKVYDLTRSYVFAGGGGGGQTGPSNSNGVGGGGGSFANSASGATGGAPTTTALAHGGQGTTATGGSASVGNEYGGASGGGGLGSGFPGGSSMNGGAGGGSGGGRSGGGPNGQAGSAGGISGSVTAGGGGTAGTAGASPGSDGGAGNAGTPTRPGDGGGGGGGATATGTTGGTGGAGGIGAGGGGGGAGMAGVPSATPGNGGAGGDGRVCIISW